MYSGRFAEESSASSRPSCAGASATCRRSGASIRRCGTESGQLGRALPATRAP